MSNKTLTAEILSEVTHLSSAKAAKVLGVSKTQVTNARARLGMKRDHLADDAAEPRHAGEASSFEAKPDGSLIIESQAPIPQDESSIHERMRARGFDPEKYTIAYRFSEWQAQSKGGEVITMYAARASATERAGKSALIPTIEYDKIVEVVENYAPELDSSVLTGPEGVTNTFVFNFADPQLGKTDINGGTEETIQRFLNSLEKAEHLLAEEPASQIIWADLGDGIENFCNTSSQRQTNDLNLVEQVRVLRRLQVEGISRLARHAPLVHVSVPSNHSQNRVGFQQAASTAHDDWGLEVSIQLEEAFALAGVEGVTFIRPEEHLESVSYATADGTVLGFVHGHRSNSQNGLEQWWAGQTLGRQPTAEADILLVGHFHNLSVRSVGAERYIITTPALDNGSSWFTVSRGSVATAGVLTMRVEDRKFRDLVIV